VILREGVIDFMMFRFAVLLIVLLVIPSAGWAETGYVIDKLTVGVHADKSLDSPILKLFTTGAKLEILKREGELAQVRGPGGETGWMEAGYLTPEEPSRAIVERLEKRTAELETQLKEAQERLKGPSGEAKPGPDASSSGKSAAQLALLEQENEVLKQQVSAERARVEQFQAKLAEAEKNAGRSNPVDETLLDQLRQENEALKKTLTEAQEKAKIMKEEGKQAEGRVASAIGGFFAEGYWIALFALVLTAAFLSGMYWRDHRHRRRYGGFRI